MMKLNKPNLITLMAASLISFNAGATLTLYTTSWSMYGKSPYEYDGAYKNGEPYGKLKYVKNSAMVAQFNQADVVAWSFLQVWNSNDPNQRQYNFPESWDGLMHFDDLWSELPLEGDWIDPLPPETNDFLKFCKINEGACASVQMNGSTHKKELFNYTDQKGVGQLNSFGAFIQSDKYKAKRIIAIGGANTPENKSISTHTFEAIFAHQDKFLSQYKSWMDHFKNLKGVDYDFEPPIDPQTGAQLPVDDKTLSDYQNLFKLVKATRLKLGADAYISVTITVNKAYIDKIDESVEGGWFKKISPYVDTVNLMTYDFHGPWGQSEDPYTSIHAFLKQPDSNHKDEFAINYATDEITNHVLSYGMPKEKLQIGIAAYGRGYAGVEKGDDPQHPGFEQPWQGPSMFEEEYTEQAGMLPYKSISNIIKNLGYVPYHVKAEFDNQSWVSGSYIYHPSAKQFVGYQSPDVVKAICQYIKHKQLKGAILWSADTDLPVTNSESLVASYKSQCS